MWPTKSLDITPIDFLLHLLGQYSKNKFSAHPKTLNNCYSLIFNEKYLLRSYILTKENVFTKCFSSIIIS